MKFECYAILLSTYILSNQQTKLYNKLYNSSLRPYIFLENNRYVINYLFLSAHDGQLHRSK